MLVLYASSFAAWAEKSTALSMNVLKKNLDSYKVRVTSNIVCEAVEKNDTHYLSKVNLGLRSKISQTQELIRKLEVAVRENTHQAAHLEKCRSNIMRVRSTMMEPLAQCKKRIGFRASIPKQTPEGDAEPEDTVTLALEQEQAALTAIIEQMKTKADALGEMLERHHVAKEKLKVDLKNKKHALELDMTCLHLEAEHASHHPSHDETLHTKVAAEAGAEAPADAMAVMKGEDAGGRFSYEWLFNQQEREQLKQSFKALANDNGEVQAMNFEAVFQNAEVAVEGNTKKVTLELLALHPDTLLTWPKFCEMLASMRGDGDGGTAVRLPHQWRAKTHALLDISEAVVMASKILLAQGLEVMKGVDETKRATNLVVQKSLRRKIRESLDCRTIAERRLQEVDVELKQLEWAEKSLEAAFEKKAKPLAVSQARYNIRRSRRKGEEVHDEVEDLISLEVEELQKGVAAIQLELDATRATLAELRSSRAELEADIKHKTISYEQDQKCLKIGSADSLKKSSHNAFLRGEI